MVRQTQSIMAILKEVMTNEASVLMDTDAANKAIDADAALQELGSDLVGEAYVTTTITVWDEMHGLPTSGFDWSKRPSRVATSPACARRSTPWKPGSVHCRATSTPMFVSRRSRRSILPI